MPPKLASPLEWGAPSGAVELAGRRSRHSKTFQLPDGRHMAAFGHGLHYAEVPDENGVHYWDETDLTFRPSGEDYLMDRAPYMARVSRFGVAAVSRETGRGIRWSVPQRPAVAGSTATFPKDGLTWTYRVTSGGLKLEATVSQRRRQRTYEFRYLSLTGLGEQDFTLDETGLAGQPDGTLQGDGFRVYAYVVGKNGVRYPCGPLRALTGRRVQFDFDDTTLPDEAFPYVIDPSTEFAITAGSRDGYAGWQGTSYPPGNQQYLSTDGSTIWVERARSAGNPDNYYVAVGLLRFDTSPLPDNIVVTGATLRLNVTSSSSPDNRSLTAGWYDPGTSIGMEDHTFGTDTSALAGVLMTSIGTGWQDFTLSGVSAVSPTGFTGFRLTISGSTPLGFNRLEFYTVEAGSNLAPRLLVTYEFKSGYHMML